MKTEAWWQLLFSMALAQLVMVGTVLAQGADVVSDGQAQDALASFVQHFVKGDWWPLLGPALVLVVWGVKKWDQDVPRVGPALSKFMDNPVVSYALPFVLSAGAGIGTSLAAGVPFKEAVPAVFKIAMEAVVLYVGGKKAVEQMAAGNAAAAAVADGGKAAAIEELKKP